VLIGFTSEQSQLRDATRDLLAGVSSEARVRALMPDPAGSDPDAWRELAGLGLPGIAIPERFGGDGGSLADQGVVLEAMGRVLCGGPYFSTAVLAAQTLLAAPDDDPVATELLEGICAGGLTVTLAVTETGGRWDEAGVRLPAAPGASGWELTGSKTFVPDGATADVILVAARTAAGISLFAVPGPAAGLARVPLPAMDQTRKQARLDFTAAGGRLIGADGAGWGVIERGLRRAAVGLAAEQAGGAQRVLELMVEHAGTRHQFGRPIGSFQAVQHTCASVLVDVEAAKSAAYYALRAVAAQPSEASQSGEDELAGVASLAKAVCSETYRHAAGAAIQVFGGIALTWEHPIQLYFKRARSSEILLGTPAYHRDLLARHLAL
jgi:alkylation response protein AidB-like acyl-CoA dehydrogenase